MEKDQETEKELILRQLMMEETAKYLKEGQTEIVARVAKRLSEYGITVKDDGPSGAES